MSTKAQVQGGIPDAVKWAVALALLGGGIAGYYVYAEFSQLYRIIGLLVAAGVALFIIGQTVKGQEAFGFIRESRNEVRKVVWPTRKETVQTTGIVFVVVVLVGLFLWALDSMLGWMVGKFLGWGG